MFEQTRITTLKTPFKTPEFKALFAEWNKRLKASGLEEVEDFSLPDAPLRVWHSLKWRKKETSSVLDGETYYALAQDVLNSFSFKNDLHKTIWELHCQGLSVRRIAESLHSKRLSKTTVNCIIMRIERQSGLKR